MNIFINKEDFDTFLRKKVSQTCAALAAKAVGKNYTLFPTVALFNDSTTVTSTFSAIIIYTPKVWGSPKFIPALTDGATNMSLRTELGCHFASYRKL